MDTRHSLSRPRQRPFPALALLLVTLCLTGTAHAESTSDGYFIDLLRLRVKQLAEQPLPQSQSLWGKSGSTDGQLTLLQSIDLARQAPAAVPTDSNNDQGAARSCIDNLHIGSEGDASRNPHRSCTTRYATRGYMQKGVYPLLGATVQGRLPNNSAEVGFIPPNITFLTFYTGNGRVSEVLLVSNDSQETATTTR